jgi:hypothetical protein
VEICPSNPFGLPQTFKPASKFENFGNAACFTGHGKLEDSSGPREMEGSSELHLHGVQHKVQTRREVCMMIARSYSAVAPLLASPDGRDSGNSNWLSEQVSKTLAGLHNLNCDKLVEVRST